MKGVFYQVNLSIYVVVLIFVLLYVLLLLISLFFSIDASRELVREDFQRRFKVELKQMKRLAKNKRCGLYMSVSVTFIDCAFTLHIVVEQRDFPESEKFLQRPRVIVFCHYFL